MISFIIDMLVRMFSLVGALAVYAMITSIIHLFEPTIEVKKVKTVVVDAQPKIESQSEKIG